MTPEDYGDQVRRFMDPYDDMSALTGDDGSAVLNITQLVERMRFGLERIELDPDVTIALEDVTDPDTLGMAVQAGMGPMVAAVFTDLAVEIIERSRPWAVGHITPARLDPNDYGFTVSPENLSAAKALIQHRLAHHALSAGDVGADAATQTVNGLVQVLASVLVFFGLVLVMQRPES